MEQGPFYDWLHNILSFVLGGPVKAAEDNHYLLSDLIMTVFVDHPLTLLGFANKPHERVFVFSFLCFN